MLDHFGTKRCHQLTSLVSRYINREEHPMTISLKVSPSHHQKWKIHDKVAIKTIHQTHSGGIHVSRVKIVTFLPAIIWVYRFPMILVLWRLLKLTPVFPFWTLENCYLKGGCWRYIFLKDSREVSQIIGNCHVPATNGWQEQGLRADGKMYHQVLIGCGLPKENLQIIANNNKIEWWRRKPEKAWREQEDN